MVPGSGSLGRGHAQTPLPRSGRPAWNRWRSGRFFGSGSDRIEDFTPGAATEDLIDLRGRGFADALNVMESAVQDGGDVVIDLGGGDEVRLVGIELLALHADDFLV